MIAAMRFAPQRKPQIPRPPYNDYAWHNAVNWRARDSTIAAFSWMVLLRERKASGHPAKNAGVT